jgi:hypothetical protein
MSNTKTWRQARAKLASHVAAHAPAEEIEQVRMEFRGLFAEDRITALIASAPELSTGQRDRLAELLRGGAAGSGRQGDELRRAFPPP